MGKQFEQLYMGEQLSMFLNAKPSTAYSKYWSSAIHKSHPHVGISA